MPDSSALALPLATPPPPHIVDRLIEERAPRLAASPPWPLLRPVLYALLSYRQARRMADAIGPLGGREALEYISTRLALKESVIGLERLPRTGRLLAVCNHPTGIADGVAVFDALRRVRGDLVFFANADALRVAPRLEEVLIPVDWIEARRTRAGARLTLERTRAALAAGAAVVIFPAGRLARRGPGGLTDPPWAASAFSAARKYDAPIVPMRLAGPASRLFHLFDRFSGELRDITVFHEFLNKRGGRFCLTIGAPIPPERLPADPNLAAAAVKAHVEQDLAWNPEAVFA